MTNTGRLLSGLAGAAVLGLSAAGGCASSGGTVSAQASGTESWRPGWWVDAPVRKDGVVTVAAMATEADLLSARQAALKTGNESLKAALGGDPTGQTETKADSIRLPGGKYRAFVLLRGERR